MVTINLSGFLLAFTAITHSNESEPIRVLYVTGGGYHNYEAQEELLSGELTERLDIIWTTDFEAGSSNDHKLALHNNPVMKSFPVDGWVSPRDELYIVTHTFENLVPLAHAYGPETDEYHVVMWVNT